MLVGPMNLNRKPVETNHDSKTILQSRHLGSVLYQIANLHHRYIMPENGKKVNGENFIVK
jgi:hypothetical protein